MLRITDNLDSPEVIRLRLDGILTSETYADVEHILFLHRKHNKRTVVLDMQGVTFLHDDAARKLAAVCGGRVRVINCSPFIQTLLETVAGQQASGD
jgi:hypothetical protein